MQNKRTVLCQDRLGTNTWTFPHQRRAWVVDATLSNRIMPVHRQLLVCGQLCMQQLLKPRLQLIVRCLVRNRRPSSSCSASIRAVFKRAARLYGLILGPAVVVYLVSAHMKPLIRENRSVLPKQPGHCVAGHGLAWVHFSLQGHRLEVVIVAYSTHCWPDFVHSVRVPRALCATDATRHQFT
jgi:hypothetical protein